MLFPSGGPDITPGARRRSGGSGGRLWDLLRRNAKQLEPDELEPSDTIDVPFDTAADAAARAKVAQQRVKVWRSIAWRAGLVLVLLVHLLLILPLIQILVARV